MFNLFIENFLIRINWARGTQVSYTNGQSDGDHPRAANQISLHPPWHDVIITPWQCPVRIFPMPGVLPFPRLLWCYPLLLSVLPLGQREPLWWTKFLPVRLKVVQPLSVIMGCMSTVGCMVYNALSLCHLFCVAVGTFFPIVTGERYLTVSQALVAHRRNTSTVVAEESGQKREQVGRVKRHQ